MQDIQDPRRNEADVTLGERDMLEAWLDFQRITLLFKCEGLDDRARKVPSSNLSLHGAPGRYADQGLSAWRPGRPYLPGGGRGDIHT